MVKLTKKDMFKDARASYEIDQRKEPDLYFAKLSYEYEGDATRDNSIEEMIHIGMCIEMNGDET